MNDASQLSLLGLKPEDVWQTRIFGSFGEPVRCYIYNPKGPRSTGFSRSVSRLLPNLNVAKE